VFVVPCCDWYTRLYEYGTTENTLQLIKPCRKSRKMNHWENMYIQIYRQNSKLIEEQ